MSVTEPRVGRAVRLAALLGTTALAGVALWWRRHPSACPYSQRFWLEPPHPLITRARLREILEPQPGERILEIGPGTGYYTLPLAEWIGPNGRLEILDIQQAMLDDTMRRAGDRGLENITPTCADAQHLPYPTERSTRSCSSRPSGRSPTRTPPGARWPASSSPLAASSTASSSVTRTG